MRKHVDRNSGSLRVGLWLLAGLLAGLLAAASAKAGDLSDLFDAIAIGEVVVASPATLDRVQVDPKEALFNPGPLFPASSIPIGRTVDPGFFTGRVRSTSVLADFTNDSLTQIQNLPVSSSVAGFTFTFQPATNTFRNDEVGFGPILADRAQTIERGMVNFGISYQRVNLTRFEGQKLSKLRLATEIESGRVYTTSPNGTGDGLDFSFLTLLLDASGGTVPTNTDFAITFPPSDIRNAMGVPQAVGTSCGAIEVTLNPFLTPDPSNALGCIFTDDRLTPGVFEVPSGTVVGNVQGIVPDGVAFLNIASPSIQVDMNLDVDVVNLAVSAGVFDRFDVGLVVPIITIDVDATVSIESFDNGCPDPLDDVCNRQFAQDVANGVIQFQDSRTITTFSASDKVSGIGDIALRAKYQPLESKWLDAAIRATLILPTGRTGDFLGTGKVGGEIALIASKTYFKRIAAHVNAAYFFSGDRSAEQIRYRAGINAIVHPRLNIGADVIGSHDVNPDGIGDDIISIGPGLKWNPWDRLVLAAAAIIRLNSEGLRADVIPAFSIEYTLD